MNLTSTSRGAPRLAIAVVAAIVALAAMAALLWPSGDGDRPPGHRATPATSAPSVAPPVSAAASPASAAPAPALAPAPQPQPVLRDGRHAVYLTDIDVPGSTVEFVLLQYLATAEEREAYEHAHPSEYGEDGYSDSPFRNDNSRLRRLPVARDPRIVVQQAGAPMCDGPHFVDFAALSENLRGRSAAFAHLGTNPFWLTVRHGTVVALDELPCAG